MEEYSNLHHKGIFDEVKAPPDVLSMRGGWCLLRRSVLLEVTRKKVRAVAKGFTDVWGEDYWHTYSPTLGWDMLFSCLAYAASHDLEIHQLDAIVAYLNSNLMEEIYLCPLDGIPTTPGMVWCLKKALYGLKQAGLEWYQTLHGHIQSIRYTQSGHDPCLYMLDSETFVIIYVDNLMVFAQRRTWCKQNQNLPGSLKCAIWVKHTGFWKWK